MSTAYIASDFSLPASAPGRLAGITFAVKDVINVAGHTTGLGNPLWLATHRPAEQTAPIVVQLLKNGARLQGITITDEFMFSIKGDNVHYGAPANPVYPEAFSGGSSSGSASAVASGAVTCALGTDTGGSIRVPAAYCNLYGLRPTWREPPLVGVAPLAESFDTVGLLARSPNVFKRVGDVLTAPTPWYPEHTLSLSTATWSETFAVPKLLAAFQRIQGYEAWHHYGAWLTHHEAALGTDIQAHFNAAQAFAKDPNAYRVAKAYQLQWREQLNTLLQKQVLCLPTTGGLLLRATDFNIGEQQRRKTQLLTAIAGLAGCPQVTIPDHGIGRSFIGPIGSDRALIAYALTQTA